MRKRFTLLVCVLMALVTGCGDQVRNAGGYRIGEYSLYVLTENQGSGSTDIFIDVPSSVLEYYAPDGTFPNAVNAVLIRKGDEIWLVDTGFGRNIFDRMASLDITADDVDHIVLTHMHTDHISGMLRDGKPAFPNADVRVAKKEYNYWNSHDEMMGQPEFRRENFELARKVIQEYGDRIKTENPHPVGCYFADGIHMLETYGHSPGHVVYLVQEGDDKFLIWGDITHAVPLQTTYPELLIKYDYDPEKACESRMKILEYVAEQAIPIVGMHIPFGGVGTLEKAEEGYTFTSLSGTDVRSSRK